MTDEKRSLYASALGIASALVYLQFNFRRTFGFVRDQFQYWSHSGTFGHVFLVGREYVLEDWFTASLYDSLFKFLPVVTQGVFLAWAFGAWLLKRDTKLRELVPFYLLVHAFTAYSDCRNIFAPNCYGEAEVFTKMRDALYFLVFLGHRLSLVAFFACVWRKGVVRLPRMAWGLAAAYGLSVAGLAILRIFLFPGANHTDACTHLVYGSALTVAALMIVSVKYGIMSAQKGSLT